MPGQHNQEGHADLGAVKTLTMEKQVVLPQSFAVIGGDDHQRAVENATTLQLAEELTQLLVQISQGNCRSNLEPGLRNDGGSLSLSM